MGYNSSVIVLNDALHEIERDPEFGRKLSAAISRLSLGRGQVDVPAGCYVTAATAIATQHADCTQIVAIGGNCGEVISKYDQTPEEMARSIKHLRNLAFHLGFSLRKRTNNSHVIRPGSVPVDQKEKALREIAEIIDTADNQALESPIDSLPQHLSEKDIRRIHALAKKFSKTPA